ncbi:MAG TPA: 3-carboxy-cis,cis-muconate cycloisomerase, partial [Acidimicrobiales bacterium]|nr:3-carboxy-cis,cis-muconate cycloisomerase [Acidimicrobiales bacterium]
REGCLVPGAERAGWWPPPDRSRKDIILMDLAATAIDSGVYGNLVGTEEMRRVFSDRERLQRYLDVEKALAAAQARLGIIPEEAAAGIARHCRVEELDLDLVRDRTEVIGYPVLPVVEQVVAACGEDHGRYVHWGATTQDITDTATVLQLRDALTLVDTDLGSIAERLASLAATHRDTPMAGRSNLQQAVPVTFGFKVAGLLATVDRHRERLSQLWPRVMVGELGGAAGTLASLGPRGLEVRRELMAELGLGEPEIAWHTARDRFGEVASFLGLVDGTLGKLATDVKLMMQTEVGEVFEPFQPGRGSSSTMPQKRNPISCNFITACVGVSRQLVAAMLEAMVADHERSTGPWEIEWVALPELFTLTAGALSQARTLLEGLEVHPEAMAANLHLTGGLVATEAVMMELGPVLGRQRAHDLIYSLTREALATNRPLVDVLAGDREIARHCDRARLVELVDPRNYVGQAGTMVDQVLAARNGPAAPAR